MPEEFIHYGCDLLEKSYLCGINNNDFARNSSTVIVVICLKSLTFVVSITTISVTCCFINSCDLLEKSYLCGINNNENQPLSHQLSVVICLKSLTFVVSITTYMGDVMSDLQVVICLKSLTFVVSITTEYIESLISYEL